jgi:peptide/nickel transport system substrate-binding protein
LTPQVEYLRNFRERYILATASGSAFMNTFNAIYYSFSPQVADYEREQSWLQQTVKVGLYPLFGILTVSEGSYNLVGGKEMGAILAGATASALIGAVYIAPPVAAYVFIRRTGLPLNARLFKLLLISLTASTLATILGVATNNIQILSISTAIFVLSIAITSAMAIGRLWTSKLVRSKRIEEV